MQKNQDDLYKLGLSAFAEKQALEIATLLALDEKGALPPKLTALHESVAAKPDTVGGWTFTGTKHFIGQQSALTSQPWLLDLLTAIEQGNSAALLAAIDKGQTALGSAGR